MLQLEKKTVNLDGKEYELACTMSVLEEVEDAHGGDFEEIMKLPARQTSLEFLAAMVNHCARKRGEAVVWTVEALKDRLSLAMLRELDLIGMVTRALAPPRSVAESAAEEAADEGN